jgi:dTDP-4-amino-4,6-dideoxygalactose transaminase
MIVSARPYPDYRKISSKNKPFGLDEMSFYPLGRDALLSGLIALGLKKGHSIIVPAFLCFSSIQPLEAYGFKLVFIDIGKSLELPVDIIKKVVAKDDSIKAILVVHYFGLTQNIDKIVDMGREYGFKVIEDASHSFMSQLWRDRGNIKGDIEIFSMRKSLPVVDGGALRINNDHFRPIKACNSRCVSIVGDFKYLALRFLERLVTVMGVNTYGQYINSIKVILRSKVTHEVYEYGAEACQVSWQLKKYLYSEKYLQSTQHKITNNFNQLSQALQSFGFRLFAESVEDNVVPQVCIIYDDNGGLVEHLRSKGIGAWRWPDIEMPDEVTHNPSQYPNTIFFDKNLALIPIHQSLGDKQINYMIKALSRWQL